MGKKTIALLSGGISPEREISLRGGDQVHKALDRNKYDVIRYDPKTDLAKLAGDASRIDAALIILHGPHGEDGTIQGMLDLLQIPYQGSGVLGSALAMDKVVTKQLYEKAGLPTPPYLVVNRDDNIDPRHLVDRLGLPLVVKPARDGSSIGLSIVHEVDAIEAAMNKAFLQGPTILAEAYIEGIEITGSVLGNDTLEPLPLIEIVPSKAHAFFDYEAKYIAGAAEEICPARIDPILTEKAQHLAVMAHCALFCRGYSRTDMILADQTIYALETNTIPGMTANSLLPRAAAKGGYPFSKLLDRLIALALEDHDVRRRWQLKNKSE